MSFGQSAILSTNDRTKAIITRNISQPGARAVLSTDDFKLVRQAVLFYMQSHSDQPEVEKFSHLYHRLGSAVRD